MLLKAGIASAHYETLVGGVSVGGVLKELVSGVTNCPTGVTDLIAAADSSVPACEWRAAGPSLSPQLTGALLKQAENLHLSTFICSARIQQWSQESADTTSTIGLYFKKFTIYIIRWYQYK